MYYRVSKGADEGFNGRYKIIGKSKEGSMYYCIPIDGQSEILNHPLRKNGFWNMYVSNFSEI